MHTKQILPILLCLVAACSAQQFYEPTTLSGPSAQLTLVSSNSGAMGNHAWWHPVDPNPEQCYDKMKSERVALFSWATAKETTISVRADRPYYLIGVASSISGAVKPEGLYELHANSVCDPTSLLALRFTPIAKESYKVTQSISDNACSMSVVDSGGRSVGELVTVKPEACPVK